MTRIAVLLVMFSALLIGPGAAFAGGDWRYGGQRSKVFDDPAHYPQYPRPLSPEFHPPRRHQGERHGSQPHHHHDGCIHRTRAVVVHPYYCDDCHVGFRFRHQFYHHLNHDHRIALEFIPEAVVRIGPTWFYFE